MEKRALQDLNQNGNDLGSQISCISSGLESSGDRFHRASARSVLFSLILAFVSGLFLYSANSPLGPSYGNDNAIYIVMGTAIARGYRPYLDIFDHKGPLVFLLQALPQLFGEGFSTLPVFIQNVLFLFLCLRIIRHISKRYFSCPDWMPQLIYLAMISSLTGEGNLTEEYANLLTLLAFSVVLGYFAPKDRDLRSSAGRRAPLLPAGIAGACCMGTFMLRANNALPTAFMAFGLAVSLILQHRIREVIGSALGFLCGAILAALPVVLWLLANGALSASIQASILHNIGYSQTSDPYVRGRVQELLLTDYGHMALFLVGIACAAAVLILRKGKPEVALGILLAAAGAGIAAFISHKYYDHYLILGVPLAALAAGYLLSMIPVRCQKPVWTVIGIAAVCWLGLQCGLENGRRQDAAARVPALFQETAELMEQVPPEDRDSLDAYRVETKWYVAAQVLPRCRYYFLQETLAEANPEVMDEIIEYMSETPPKWLVIFSEARSFHPPYDERMAAILETRYETVKTAGDYRLMHLLDE